MNRRQFSQLALLAVARPGLADTPEPLYREKYRPQFHFSPKKGWTNDPNGLVFYKGEYHLFFQHNPFDVKWGNMTWGHAISRDMVRWTQIENALEPDAMGTMFSGSAVVDWNNTAGLQTRAEKVIVLIYTAAGGTNPESKGKPFTQCIAYSNDRGRTWTKYAGNPVIPHIKGENRDPKVVWHAPARQWIMALFLDGNTYGFLSSPDLKKWTMLHQISVPKVAECPDFFEMPVENESGVSKWVWTGANGNYLVGSFDGKRFNPEVMTQPLSYGANYYAVQTFSDLPGHRRVQMSWMNGGLYPGMPFNQQMSCPYELRLRKDSYDSYRLFALPIQEVETLREAPRNWKNLEVKPGDNPLEGMTGDLWDICAEIEPNAAKEVGFKVGGGRSIAYTVPEKPGHNTMSSGTLSAVLPLRDGRFKVRILVDRTTVETFGNDGEIVIPTCFLPEKDDRSLELFARGGAAKIVSLDVYPMRSAWRV
jgi:fructan beta-fructosidase